MEHPEGAISSQAGLLPGDKATRFCLPGTRTLNLSRLRDARAAGQGFLGFAPGMWQCRPQVSSSQATQTLQEQEPHLRRCLLKEPSCIYLKRSTDEKYMLYIGEGDTRF